MKKGLKIWDRSGNPLIHSLSQKQALNSIPALHQVPLMAERREGENLTGRRLYSNGGRG